MGPHLSCGFNVTFTPSQTGAETGSLIITDALRSQSVSLSGNGISPAASSLAPLSLVFAGQVLNVASTSQKVVLTNAGDVALTGIDAQVSGDFVLKSSCSTSLAAHSTCNLNVSYLPTHTGPESGSLTVVDAVNSQTVALTGTGLAPATDTLSPPSLAFPDQPLNVASTAQKVSLTNSGDVALTGITAQVSGDFALKNSCSASLAAHSSCTLNVIFQPTQPGLESGVLTVTDGLQSQLVALTGTGLAGPQDTLSTAALDFGGQLVNSPGAAQIVTLANLGDETLSGVSAQVTGDFVLKSGCGASLASHSTCALSVVYTPTQTGTQTGTLTVIDALRSQSVSLSGTGLSPPTAALSPQSLVFSGQPLGVASTSQKAVLTNTGDIPLTGITVQITGDFSLKNSCGASLAAHSTCNLSVTFLPTLAGPESGALTVNDALGSQVVSLSGTGLAGPQDALSAAAVDFGGQLLNVAGSAQSVTLANTGDATLSEISAQTTGDFQLKNGCNKTLAAQTSCALTLTFKPTATGSGSGTLVVSDSIRTQTVTLSGMGTDFQVQAATSNSVTLSSGQSETVAMQIESVATKAGVAICAALSSTTSSMSLSGSAS